MSDLGPVMAGSPPPSRDEGLVLCLSGGGFRATFFHLGVIRYLSAIHALEHVTDIFAVSGGSILAAHLAQRWAEYKNPETFDLAAEELRTFAYSDVRGRIVRTWLLSGTCFGLPLYVSRLRRDQLLIREYQRFFGQQGRDTDLKALNPALGTRIHLLTTSLTTGQLCEFSASGFMRFDDRFADQPLQNVRVDDHFPNPALQSARFNIPLAVAASSAFPPLFPPVRIDADRFQLDVKAFGVDVDHLTDGGVYDNLGIRAATERFVLGFLSGKEILVSDASASFKWKTRRSFSTIVGRTQRAIDVLMRRVAELEVDVEMIALSAARLGISKRQVELERDLARSDADVREPDPAVAFRQPHEIRVPRLQVVGIDGRRDDSLYNRLDVEIGGGFYGFRNRLVGIQRRTSMTREESWAVAMASIRTDLDKFSLEECRFLETWGYEQTSAAWSPPAGFGPPGSRPPAIAQHPTQMQLIGLEESARTKLGLIAPRDGVGKTLLVAWALVIAIGVSIGWYFWP